LQVGRIDLIPDGTGVGPNIAYIFTGTGQGYAGYFRVSMRITGWFSFIFNMLEDYKNVEIRQDI